MKASTLFKSKYLKAADLSGDVNFVIEDASVERLRDGSEKLVVYFQGTEQGLILNKTNYAVLAKAIGDETDVWRGKPVQLYTEQVHFQGENALGIRLRVLKELPAFAAGDVPF